MRGKQLLIISVALVCLSAAPVYENGVKRFFVGFLQDYLSIVYEDREFRDYLYVAVKKQKIFHIDDGKVMAEYQISTSKHGVGHIQDSEQTPDGLHVINRKIGDNIPINGIYESRSFTGEIAEIENRPVSTGKDEVTTRIMWLGGKEPGINKGGNNDSYMRHIYIHGTTEEGLIGTPSSHGCIRMKNKDVLELYERTFEGMYVVILNN